MQMVIAATRRSAGPESRFAEAILVLAGMASGAGFGFVVGLVGWLMGPDLRTWFAAAALLALLMSSIVRPTPIELKRQTRHSWMTYQDWRTALLTGAELGPGLLTRIGFWAWFAVPVSAFAIGSPVSGAIVWAVYAGARLLTASVIRSQELNDSLIWAVPRIGRYANILHVVPLGIAGTLMVQSAVS